MATNPVSVGGKIFGILMVCIIFCGWNQGNGNFLKEKLTNQKEPDLRKELISIAQSQVGIKEATGKNDGRDVYKYQKNVGLASGVSWCGCFVTWNFDSLQKVTTTILKYPRTGVAAEWLKNNRTYTKNKSETLDFKPGMIAGEGNNSITHVAIVVEKWDAYHYVTIGGNESNGVKRSVKHVDNLQALSDYLQ